MKARTASRAAWSLWYLVVGLSAASFVLTLLNRSVLNPTDTIVLVGTGVAAVGYGTVGALISASRQNRIGWIFCTISLGFALFAFTWTYVIRGLVTAPGSLPGTAYMAWVRTWVLTLALAPIPLVFLLFPNGLLPSRRWRPVAWILIVGPALNLVGTALRSGVLFEQYGVRVENPFGIAGIGEGNWLAFVVPALIWFGAAISSVVALVRRFRGAKGEERQQLKWLAYVAGTAVALLFPGLILGAAGLSGFSGVVSLALSLGALFIGIPVASAIAILKYRLYDLDVVVKKTVVFGILAVLVSVLYIGVVVGIGSAVKGSERSPATVLTFLAAAILALLFQPIRRRVQQFIDRRFFARAPKPAEAPAT